MSTGQAILAEAGDSYTAVLLVGWLLTFALGRGLGAVPRRRLFGIGVFCMLHVLLLPLVGAMRADGSGYYRDARLAALIFAGLGFVSMSGVLLFGIVLPRLKISLPRILQDVVIGVASIFVLFAMAAHAGFNLSGLITTSAVLTAVLGLALQDTLGNIVAGLALQTDDSIRVGDWIAVDQHEGRVTEIRWRYVAIETRDWETVLLPNSQLVKGQVRIMGKRGYETAQYRRWVRFNVDFRFAPPDVVAAVIEALRRSPITGVASQPEPDCIIEEMADSYARYAVRYHVTDLTFAPTVDSRVLTRVVVALKRKSIPLSMPAQSVFLTSETEARRRAKSERERDRRMLALRGVELVNTLSEDELGEIADRLIHLPYSAGEVLARQGEEGRGLFILTSGHVAVFVHGPAGDSRIAELGPGDFFGEGGLLTGERRTATVKALDDVDAYQLNKEVFETILAKRPDIADHLAEVLTRRRAQLADAEQALQARPDSEAEKLDLLGRIRDFFKLGDGRRE
jgi:small-conductance mechanosensitive channel/CRP-like cAMP-binding protein